MIVTLTNPHLKEILATFNLSTLYTRLITLISHSLCEISSAPCVCKPINHHHIYQSLIKHLPKSLNMPMSDCTKPPYHKLVLEIDPLSNHFFQHILLLNLINVFLRIPPN